MATTQTQTVRFVKYQGVIRSVQSVTESAYQVWPNGELLDKTEAVPLTTLQELGYQLRSLFATESQVNYASVNQSLALFPDRVVREFWSKIHLDKKLQAQLDEARSRFEQSESLAKDIKAKLRKFKASASVNRREQAAKLWEEANNLSVVELRKLTPQFWDELTIFLLSFEDKKHEQSA